MSVAAIVVHALSGALALAAGVVAFERPPRGLGVYLVSLILMLGSLGVALGLEWGGLDTTTRVVFLALSALGVVVVVRGVEAVGRRPRDGAPAVRAYRNALGFTLVALTDAFVVVTVLDLAAPVWAAVLVGALVAVVGHVGVRRRSADLEGASGPAVPAAG